MKKSWSLNIKAGMLKTVLFYPRCVKVGSVIYPAFFCHFPSLRNRRSSAKSPFRKPAKMSENSKQGFPLFSFLATSNSDSLVCSCILPSWENGIPLNRLPTPGGRLFNPPKRKHVLKRAERHRCEVKTLGTFACNFSTFFRVSQRDSNLENCLQNLNGVTDFSQKNFPK